MATYTTNLNLKKPAQSDKIRIADINGNSDDIDAAFGAIGTSSVATQIGNIESGMAIVSVGDTHAAISAGQYVYVKGHGTLSEGLYTANSALAANASLTSSNVTAVSSGGLNSLSDQIDTLIKVKSVSKTATTDANGFWQTSISGINAIVGIKITSVVSQPDIFIKYFTALLPSNNISVKFVIWNDTAVANTEITCTVYYI